LRDRVEQRLQPRTRVGMRRFQHRRALEEFVAQPLRHRVEQLVLGPEVVVDVAQRHARLAGDVRQGRVPEPLAMDEAPARLEKPLALVARLGHLDELVS
jgi:hypothetical protein